MELLEGRTLADWVHEHWLDGAAATRHASEGGEVAAIAQSPPAPGGAFARAGPEASMIAPSIASLFSLR